MRSATWMALSVGALVLAVGVLAVLLWTESSETGSAEKLETVAQETASTTVPAIVVTSQAGDDATELSPRNAPEANSSDLWLFVTLAAMAIALIISSAISFYLYYWRKILLSKPHMLVPEQSGELMEAMLKRFSVLNKAVSVNLNESTQQGQQVAQGISDLTETYMTMQQALDDREQEIRRLKRGYDSEIFRKFVTRFISVDQAVGDFQRLGSANEAGLDQISRLLKDAFAECNVENFQPELRSDYRRSTGVADHPKTKKSERAEDDFMICEILENGYLIRSPESSEIIIPAKVRIYRYQVEDQEVAV